MTTTAVLLRAPEDSRAAGRAGAAQRLASQLWIFARVEALCCVFPLGVFAGLGLTQVVATPIPRYDALLVWCLLLTAGCWASGLETTKELLVIAAFHALGVTLEVFKVRHGSWSYPGHATLSVAGVPLFSGFMYSAVGSYLCQAWRRFDLRLSAYRAGGTTATAVALYANFFTHHYLPDLRMPLAAVTLGVLWPCRVHFTVGGSRYRMPLAVSFVLIGFFLWLAENAATLLSA